MIKVNSDIPGDTQIDEPSENYLLTLDLCPLEFFGIFQPPNQTASQQQTVGTQPASGQHLTFRDLAQLSESKCNFSHHFSSLLGRAGLPQGENVAADGDLPPDAGFGVLAEAVTRVHHQHAVGGQPIHLTIKSPPLGGLLLKNIKREHSAVNQSLL